MQITKFIVHRESIIKYVLHTQPNKGYPRCKYPRERIPVGTSRPFMYINGDQKIEFPESLWGTIVTVDDPIEMELIELENNYPDFYYIKIEKIDIK